MTGPNGSTHAELYRLTDPARDRFARLLEEDAERAEEFRAALRDYAPKYGFLAHVVGLTDRSRSLERLYVYGKMLIPRLARRQDPGIDLVQVDLIHLRIGKTGEHDLALTPEDEQMLPGFTGDGTGGRHERPRMSLAELIAELNERFGGNLGEGDIVRGSAEAAMAEPQVRAAAFANDEDNFGHVFDEVFEDEFYERIENDTKAVQKFADDPEFNSQLRGIARRYAYESLRRDVAWPMASRRTPAERYELAARIGRGGMGEGSSQPAQRPVLTRLHPVRTRRRRPALPTRFTR